MALAIGKACHEQLESGEQVLKERRNPMKVKTNTKAGNALWGS
jgi:hypothetical protein